MAIYTLSAMEPPPKRQRQNPESLDGMGGVGDEEIEKGPGFIIVYKHTELIHRALGLSGLPVPQGPTPQASSDAFQSYVYGQLVSGVPDRGGELCGGCTEHGRYHRGVFPLHVSQAI